MTADNFFNHAKKTFKDEISSINHSLDNLHLLCYNCFFITKPTGRMLTTPKNDTLLRKKLEEVYKENND